MKEKIGLLEESLGREKTELISKDEHVRVLSQQNQQMLELLESEEAKTKDTTASILILEEENNSLKALDEEFDRIKTEIENLISQKKQDAL